MIKNDGFITILYVGYTIANRIIADMEVIVWETLIWLVYVTLNMLMSQRSLHNNFIFIEL